jgi:cytochrome c-type biogenesis protein CcmH/NrfG
VTASAASRLWLIAAVCVGLVVAGAAATSPFSGGASDSVHRGSGPTSSPSPTAVAPPSLLTAEALFFNNRYEAADQAYRDILSSTPGDSGAQSAYALFLNYRHNFSGALQHANQAVTLAPDNGHAFAVLCRVNDWSNKLDDAVTSGARAVQLAPRDLLAHLFYSEALADHGDTAESRREITAASALVTPGTSAYERAEIRREDANLAHDLGNLVLELSDYQAAYDAQPTWVERAAELAFAYIANGNLAGARQSLDKAISLAPRDAALLATLGEVSVLQPDYTSAEKAYGVLLELRPKDPAVLDMNAQVAMAGHQDSARARQLLQQALSIDPSDAEAAAYLLYIDRDVEGDDALATRELNDAVGAARDDLAPTHLRPALPDPDAQLAAHASAALAEVNAVRARAGLPAVQLDEHLTKSAVAHSFYWLFNNGSSDVARLGIHRETFGFPGFSGVLPLDRDRTFGYFRGGGVGEDITHRGAPVAAVADWVNSVYHRFPILRPDLVAIGYGDAVIGPITMEDMEFGFVQSDGPHHAPVAYPAPQAQQVPTTFVDNELPDPVPPGAPRTTGYPVTLNFDIFARVTMTRFYITAPDGTELPGYTGAPTPDAEKTAWVLPQAPLKPHTTYTAHFTGTLEGVAYDKSWSFTTAG